MDVFELQRQSGTVEASRLFRRSTLALGGPPLVLFLETRVRRRQAWGLIAENLGGTCQVLVLLASPGNFPQDCFVAPVTASK